MKAVLMSIQPKWCKKICNLIGHDENFNLIHEKTVEVRKTKPKLNTPFKVYIYCTKGAAVLKTIDKSIFIDKAYKAGENLYGLYEHLNGKVIGEFICDELSGGFWISPFSDYLQRQSCLSYDEVCDYANGKPIFAWHISDLVIYDKPKNLNEFGLTRPPQSWCYVESEVEG